MNQREEGRLAEVVREIEDQASGTPVAKALGIRLLGGLAPSLASRCYVDPGIYARERKQLFYTRWLCGGRQEEWTEPGEYALRDVAGESVIVVRDKAGEIHALYNVCRHRGSVFRSTGGVGGGRRPASGGTRRPEGRRPEASRWLE